MKRNNHLLPCLALLLVSAGCRAGQAVSHTNSPAPATPVAAARLPVAVEVFEVKAEAPGAQLIPAVLSTEATATVLAQRDGALIELRAQEGAHVKKGELLARLNADDLPTQLEQAQLEVARLSVEERQHEALVKVNQSELEQEAALLKDGLTSKRQYERAEHQLEGSVQELEKVRLATQAARSRVAAVRIEAGKCLVRAPLSGVVTHRFAKLGASIVRNDKLFEVAQLAPLAVRFQAPQSGQTPLSPGRLLDLSLAGSDQIIARARLRRLDPVIDVLSNTRGYWAEVSGGAGLIPGQAVLVHLPRVARAGATATLLVPRAAFPAAAGLRPDAPAVLFVLDGDRARSRAVQVQALAGERVEIKDGLAFGERVILAPPAELKDGDPAQVR